MSKKPGKRWTRRYARKIRPDMEKRALQHLDYLERRRNPFGRQP